MIELYFTLLLMSGPFWNIFEKEGEEAYYYFIENIGHMIQEGERILHFSIQPSWNGNTVGYYRYIQQFHYHDVESDTLAWIHRERDAGRLLVRDNWLPYRHSLDHTTSFLGYRGLFCVKEYIFQLGIDVHGCDDDCADCLSIDVNEGIPHFQAMVYGRKGEVEGGWLSDREWKKK